MADLNFALLDLLFFLISIKPGDKNLNDFLKGSLYLPKSSFKGSESKQPF
jgi:hypothetical protein